MEVGSGNGELTRKLLSLGFKGESLDYSAKAVNFMRHHIGKNPNLKIRLGNIFTFKNPKRYDAVFAFETLEHIKDDLLCIKKIYQLLKPGGIFVLSVPAHKSLWNRVDDLKGHFRRYESRELQNQVKKIGFTVKQVWCYGFPFLNLLRLISGSGKFIESPIPGSISQRTSESSIQQEYDPIFLPLVTSPLIRVPLYAIMNIFLETDLGLGYILVAQK